MQNGLQPASRQAAGLEIDNYTTETKRTYEKIRSSDRRPGAGLHSLQPVNRRIRRCINVGLWFEFGLIINFSHIAIWAGHNGPQPDQRRGHFRTPWLSSHFWQSERHEQLHYWKQLGLPGIQQLGSVRLHNRLDRSRPEYIQLFES